MGSVTFITTFVISLLIVGAVGFIVCLIMANKEVRAADGFNVYACCNHCFSEDGELSHPRSMMDKHTVPCNEPFCSQNPKRY